VHSVTGVLSTARRAGPSSVPIFGVEERWLEKAGTAATVAELLDAPS
jgi:hypothetical protein